MLLLARVAGSGGSGSGRLGWNGGRGWLGWHRGRSARHGDGYIDALAKGHVAAIDHLPPALIRARGGGRGHANRDVVGLARIDGPLDISRHPTHLAALNKHQPVAVVPGMVPLFTMRQVLTKYWPGFM